MELHLKTQHIDLDLTLDAGEQDTAQLILAELSHAGVLNGTPDQRQILMARYLTNQSFLPTLKDMPLLGHIPNQHVLPMGHVPTQYVPEPGRVPDQHVLPMGHVPTQYVPEPGHVPDQHVLPMGHVPTQYVPEPGHVPNIPNAVDQPPLYQAIGHSPRWGAIAVIVGIAIGLLILSWRWHTQPTPKPETIPKATTKTNPPTFHLPPQTK